MLFFGNSLQVCLCYLLYTRSLRNRLTINFDKTKFMMVSFQEHQNFYSFKFIGLHSIQNVNNYKFLGVTIDNTLTFRSYVNNFLSKVSKSAGFPYQLGNYLPPETHLSFLYRIIYSHLSYNISVSGTANKSILKPLTTAQKRINRNIDGATYRIQTKHLFVKFFVLKISDFYSYVTDVKMLKTIRAQETNL